jgi:hypothetical protein
MEQSFLLKYHGGYDLWEQANMPAEERAWNIKRIDKEIKEVNKRSQESKQSKPHHPNIK